MLTEYEPRCFEVHFTSRRNVPREQLLAAAVEIRDAFVENGAERLVGWIAPRNRAMCLFLTDLGFRKVGQKEFPENTPCDNDTQSATLPTQTRVFCEYAFDKGEPL